MFGMTSARVPVGPASHAGIPLVVDDLWAFPSNATKSRIGIFWPPLPFSSATNCVLIYFQLKLIIFEDFIMFAPDLGSSAFPVCSVGVSTNSPHDTTVQQPQQQQRRLLQRQRQRRPKRGKRVSFADTLTVEYEIAARDCRRRLSVSVEEMKNRVRHLQRELDLEYQDLDRDGQIENELEETNLQYLEHGHVVALVKLRNAIERLKKQKETIQDDIEFLRIDTLRLKGAQKSLAKAIQDRNAGSKTMHLNSLSLNLVRAFWTNTLARIDAIEH
jgi:hypothetical protein